MYVNCILYVKTSIESIFCHDVYRADNLLSKKEKKKGFNTFLKNSEEKPEIFLFGLLGNFW